MEYTDKEYCLEVWGDWACFTRPELKVERVSYDVITPSAARAIFEAIFLHPCGGRKIITTKIISGTIHHLLFVVTFLSIHMIFEKMSE